jgi:hypothetical protein
VYILVPVQVPTVGSEQIPSPTPAPIISTFLPPTETTQQKDNRQTKNACQERAKIAPLNKHNRLTTIFYMEFSDITKGKCHLFKRWRRRKDRQNGAYLLLVTVCFGMSLVTSLTLLPVHPIYNDNGRPRLKTALRSTTDKLQGAPLVLSNNNEPQNNVPSSKHNSPTPPSTNYPISPEQLDQLTEHVDIVSVVESYGLPKFQRRGDNRAVAICPFHEDSNPSLSIDGTRRIFKCFACGAGGNAINFVRTYTELQGEELSFMQVVKHLNEKFYTGAPLIFGGNTGSMSAEERQKLAAKRERILLANAAAAAFYATCLVSLPSGGVARSHLQSRGLIATTVRAFAMGFAPDVYFGGGETQKGFREWGEGSLVHHLRGQGFLASEILDAGLAIRTKKSLLKQSDILVDDTNTNNTTSNSTGKTGLVSICLCYCDRVQVGSCSPIICIFRSRSCISGGVSRLFLTYGSVPWEAYRAHI